MLYFCLGNHEPVCQVKGWNISPRLPAPSIPPDNTLKAIQDLTLDPTFNTEDSLCKKITNIGVNHYILIGIYPRDCKSNSRYLSIILLSL